MKAYCLIRRGPAYRHDAFISGLQKSGYEICNVIPAKPNPEDVLIIWNRYGSFDRHATVFEDAGAKVLIAENGYLGREWRGGYWYAISANRHNGGGSWPDLGPSRWDSWGIELKPWRKDGRHVLVLLQRGIGMPPVAQPKSWETKLRQSLKTDRPIVWRGHPGEKKSHETLYDDLKDAWCVVTWASGGALKALVEGVPVFYGYERWIGAQAAKPFSASVEDPHMGDRLPMFRRLAWAMWNTEDIASGEPFSCLLSETSPAV